MIGKPPGLAATLSQSAVARFGVFELDLRRRELRRKGILIKLHQQPYEVLALLVRHRGELVSRELIQQTLWPNGHFVDFERSINTAIRKLRRALRETASAPAYIETVPRMGYRLIAQVVERPAEARIETIAVLPLKDLSNDPDAPFFVDALTDALITEIARRSDLGVVSHTRLHKAIEIRRKPRAKSLRNWRSRRLWKARFCASAIVSVFQPVCWMRCATGSYGRRPMIAT